MTDRQTPRLNAEPRPPRASNFELLRIVAMILIVTTHYFEHGIQQFEIEKNSSLWLSGSLSHRLITVFFSSSGGIGNGVFFILTGYFMCHAEWRPKRLLKIFLEVLFYSVPLYIIYLAMHLSGVYTLTSQYPPIVQYVHDAVGAITPGFGGRWWFLNAYFILFAMIPCINAFINACNKKTFILLTAVFWALVFCPGRLGVGYSDIQYALLFYLFGAILRMYPLPLNKYVSLAGAALSWALCFAINTQFFDEGTIVGMLAVAIRSGILTPLCALGLFDFFSKLKMPYIKSVNTISSATLGVYIIHESSLAHDFLWYKTVCPFETQYPSPLFPLYALLTIAAIYVVCTAIDLARQRLFARLSRVRDAKG